MTMLSRLFLCLILLILSQGLSLQGLAKPLPPENCTDRPFDEGRLWKVSRDNVPPSYIFGTMHSKDPRILHIPGVVMQVFIASTTAIFETSLKDDEIAQNQRLLLLSPGKSLQKLVGDKRFEQLTRLVEPYGMAPTTLDRLKIWAAATIISQPPPEGTNDTHSLTLLDKELEKSALQSGKRVIALESYKEQLDIFDTMPKAVQLEFLDQAIAEHSELNEELEKMTSYYLSGNTGWIACDLEETLEGASAALNNIMTNDLIYTRNHHMVERMLPELARGNVFVGIGALHLPGEEGVLSLLKEKGYSIERKY